MKHLLIFLTIVVPYIVYAALSESDRDFLIPRNLLTNPGFETSKQFWVASGGATTYQIAVTTASVGTGNAALRWLNVASTSSLDSTAVTIPAGYYNNDGLVGCFMKGEGAVVALQALQGSTVLGESTVNLSTDYANTLVGFTFPTSGNIKLRIRSASTSNPAILIDDCYLGTNVGISNPSALTKYSWSGNHGDDCAWSTASTSFVDVSDDSTCSFVTKHSTNLTVSSSGNVAPAITFTPDSAGVYMITASLTISNSTAAQRSYARLWDGANELSMGLSTIDSNSAPESITLVGMYNAVGASETTIKIQLRTNANTVTLDAITSDVKPI